MNQPFFGSIHARVIVARQRARAQLLGHSLAQLTQLSATDGIALLLLQLCARVPS